MEDGMSGPGYVQYEEGREEYFDRLNEVGEMISKCAALSKAVWASSAGDAPDFMKFDQTDIYYLADVLRDHAIGAKKAFLNYDEARVIYDHGDYTRIRRVYDGRGGSHWESCEGSVWRPLPGVHAKTAEEVFAILKAGREKMAMQEGQEAGHAAG